MASSTTSPIDRIKASSVSKLIEKPKAASSMNEPITETGMAAVGIKVARGEYRNAKITSTTTPTATSSVITTSSMLAWINSASSVATVICTLSGRRGRSRSSSARTPADTARVLALD